MNSSATPSHAADRAFTGKLRILLPAALWTLLFLAILKLPASPTSGLDPSWRMVIGYAFDHGLQWGRDLVFTYGPLGFLVAGTNRGAHYDYFLLWQFVSSATFATILWHFGRNFRGWQLAVYYLFLVGLVAPFVEAIQIIVVLILGLAPLRSTDAPRRGWLAFAGTTLAVLALVKFTYLIMGGVAIGCVGVHHAVRGRWRDFASFGGSFLIGLLVCWLLCGQQLGNLPAYISSSLATTAGYGDGMSVYEDNVAFALGLAAALSMGGYLTLTLVRRADFPRALTTATILAAFLFLNWKHGFTRADGHMLAHFLSCLFVLLTFPFVALDDGPLLAAKKLLLSISAVACGLGIFLYTRWAVTDAPAVWYGQMKTSFATLAHFPRLSAKADEEFERVATLHTMKDLVARVGREPIGFLGNEQAYLLFNHLNYAPNPAFQSYLPYTAELLKRNESFLKSSHAPLYYLQKIDTIDFRLPPLDDSLAANYLYHHYRCVAEESGMFVWVRQDWDATLDERTLIGSLTPAFGQNIEIPNRSETPIWAEIEIQPSFLGRVREFLYKPPQITMNLDAGTGTPANYRVIRRMASVGFLAYPFFTDAASLHHYLAGEIPPRARSFSLTVKESWRKYFQPEMTVRFYALKPLAGALRTVADAEAAKYPMFNRVPARVVSPYPSAIVHEGADDALFIHPPSRLEFRVTFPGRHLTGRFGLLAKSYAPPNATDGAEFIVEWQGADGATVVLFSRLLRPLEVVADRGTQSFEVSLPPGDGSLTLRTEAGPKNNVAFDWTYWTDVKFAP